MGRKIRHATGSQMWDLNKSVEKIYVIYMQRAAYVRSCASL